VAGESTEVPERTITASLHTYSENILSEVKHSPALEHGLQVMLDLLTNYLGNAATRGEWLVEIQRRFTGRNKKLRRGWSDDSIDRKIKKLEQMGLITGGRDGYWSASLLGFADNTDDPQSAPLRKLSANDSFLDVLNAAKQQLL